jgi:hypothetical protein
METLDLAEVDEWLRVTEMAIKDVVPSEVQEALRDHDPEDMYHDTLEYFLNACDTFGLPCSRDEWDSVFDQEFGDRFSSIRAFHACRITDIDSYRSRGIVKLSRALLRELCHDAFSKHATAAVIDKAVDNYDIPDFDKSVFLFTDMQRPFSGLSNGFLQGGSEFVQAISISLGLHSRGILASRGSAYLIECTVPIPRVHVAFRLELWRKFVTAYFMREAGFQIADEAPDFCIRVDSGIAPDEIVKFHECNLSEMISHHPLN